MTTNNFYRSDLPKLHNIVQNSMIVYPKEAILATLKDYFSHDTYYRYAADEWGYNKTPDQTDLPLDAGMYDNTTTRLGIFEANRFDVIFYPCIIVKTTGSKSVPISLNREDSTISWEVTPVVDNYGNSTVIKRPKSFVFAGAWEGGMSVEIMTRSLRARDDLVELVSILLTDISFKSLVKAGVLVKPITIGAPAEADDRNDKLFKQSVTFDVRTEWRREIPIGNFIDVINFNVEFANLSSPNPIVAPNLTINIQQTVVDSFLNT
jgi:hypothetical protein